MNSPSCAETREALPLYVEGIVVDASGVEAHLEVCEDCRAELELVRLLVTARPTASHGLADRVVSAVLADRRPRLRPWWGLSAAAVAALALGIGVTSSGPGAGVPTPPEFATELEEEDLWPSGDGLLAGAPALEALSDEALAQLLDELELEGGSA